MLKPTSTEAKILDFILREIRVANVRKRPVEITFDPFIPCEGAYVTVSRVTEGYQGEFNGRIGKSGISRTRARTR